MSRKASLARSKSALPQATQYELGSFRHGVSWACALTLPKSCVMGWSATQHSQKVETHWEKKSLKQPTRNIPFWKYRLGVGCYPQSWLINALQLNVSPPPTPFCPPTCVPKCCGSFSQPNQPFWAFLKWSHWNTRAKHPPPKLYVSPSYGHFQDHFDTLLGPSRVNLGEKTSFQNISRKSTKMSSGLKLLECPIWW